MIKNKVTTEKNEIMCIVCKQAHKKWQHNANQTIRPFLKQLALIITINDGQADNLNTMFIMTALYCNDQS